jgi:hypothetical protein
VSEALDTVRKTLGEGFAEYDSRQMELDELYIVNDFFVEYFVSQGTQQRKVIVTADGTADGNRDRAFADCTRTIGKE